jgi:hypothetical protein
MEPETVSEQVGERRQYLPFDKNCCSFHAIFVKVFPVTRAMVCKLMEIPELSVIRLDRQLLTKFSS